MIFEDTSRIQDAFERRDLQALRRLVGPGRKESSYKIHPRSTLMVSAHRIKHLNKMDELSCDMVMLNLEDGVSPELKPFALVLAQIFLQHTPKEVYCVVRVNPLDQGGTREIEALNAVGPDAIRIPKVTDERMVARALDLVDESIEVHLSIETKEAFHNLERLRLSPRISTYHLGILDLLADLHLPQHLLHQSNPTIQYIMSRFLVTAKMTGVHPVGFTFQDHRDLETFRDWCEFEKTMGYETKSCIAPKQVTIANAVFKRGEKALAKAQKIKERFECNAAKGITGFDDPELGFIDEPIYKDALNLLRE